MWWVFEAGRECWGKGVRRSACVRSKASSERRRFTAAPRGGPLPFALTLLNALEQRALVKLVRARACVVCGQGDGRCRVWGSEGKQAAARQVSQRAAQQHRRCAQRCVPVGADDDTSSPKRRHSLTLQQQRLCELHDAFARIRPPCPLEMTSIGQAEQGQKSRHMHLPSSRLCKTTASSSAPTSIAHLAPEPACWRREQSRCASGRPRPP